VDTFPTRDDVSVLTKVLIVIAVSDFVAKKRSSLFSAKKIVKCASAKIRTGGGHPRLKPVCCDPENEFEGANVVSDPML
jgi:hypothetical protein